MQDELNSVSPDTNGAPAPEESGADPVAALIAERDQLVTEVGRLTDQLLRRTAEFDNFRKRSDRERRDLLEFGAQDALKSMLPILDNFERALAVDTSDKVYARGVELIYQRTLDTLKGLGLEPINAQGQPFDPNLHEAIETMQSEELDDHTVAADLQRGYLFKGRLLRPSMVKVAVKPS